MVPIREIHEGSIAQEQRNSTMYLEEATINVVFFLFFIYRTLLLLGVVRALHYHSTLRGLNFHSPLSSFFCFPLAITTMWARRLCFGTRQVCIYGQTIA